jgi:hypothetical protein
MPPRTYEELLNEERVKYKAIKLVHCPILGMNVHFTSQGFHHLLFDGLGHARTKSMRMYRLGLLPLVKAVLFTATRIEHYTPSTYSKKLKKLVEYWRITSIVGRQDSIVTVILRKVGNGNVTFHSIFKKRDRSK